VEKSLGEIVAESQTTNEAQVTLRSLDSAAQTSRALYDTFLQRYMESVQQQSFSVTEARVITKATRPFGPSAPRSGMALAIATMGGIILGIGVGVLREISDRVFRTSGQVEQHLRATCIAVVPLVKGTVRPSVERVEHSIAPPQPRNFARDNGPLWTVVDSPFSAFAEAIRGIKVAADLSKVVHIPSF
jgi:polysaccharide biosynthesis transport protein